MRNFFVVTCIVGLLGLSASQASADSPQISTGTDSVTVRTDSTSAVYVKNLGTADLTVDNITVPDSFSVGTSLPLVIGPGDSTAFEVTFHGVFGATGAIVVHSDDPVTENYTLAIRGFGVTDLGGTYSGTWTAALSPYHVVDHILVPIGEELVIEPGVDVIFDGNFAITVTGQIQAIGTESDSIRFYPVPDSAWGGLHIHADEDSVDIRDSLYVRAASAFRYVRMTGQRGPRLFGYDTSRGAVYARFVQLSFSHVVIDGIVGFYWGAALSLDNCITTIDSSRFTNNRFDETTDRAVGGAIMVGGASLDMQDCVISGNEATTGRFGWAGAMTISFADVTMTRCTVTHNVAADSGGAFYVRDYSHLVLNDCIVDSNTALSGVGGAIYVAVPNLSTPPLAGVVEINGGTVKGNKAAKSCGAYSPPTGGVVEVNGADVSGNLPEDAEVPLSVSPASAPVPFTLYQNAPNPFNPSTSISFGVASAGRVSVTVYDVTGREVRALVHRDFAPGIHEVAWNGRDNTGRPVASGVYMYRYAWSDGTQSSTATKRMLLLR